MKIKLLIILIIFFCFNTTNVLAKQLRADAVVERQEVYKGESFVFQIQIQGSENPSKPDISSIKNFNIEELGGQQNSSRSVTIINGRMNEVVKEGYVFSYRLTPLKEGNIEIPSIQVKADGKLLNTNSIPIKIIKPEKMDDFKLQLELSKTRCYIGEPIILKVTFYLNQSIQSLSFNVPLLNREDLFYFANKSVDTNDGGKYFKLPINNEEIIGKEGRGYFEGKNYTTISFEKILIPKTKGDIKIDEALVESSVLDGYKTSRHSRNSPFRDDFFSSFFDDSFFSSRQRKFKKVVIPSNSLNLKILDLPSQGKPNNFFGHIGEYQIQAIANPLDVSVGDPITLQIILKGPKYLDHIQFPSLHNQPNLVKNFKIPKEMGDGETSHNSKLFTQTIRALNSKITEIPSIELPYFDTKEEKYKIAITKPIPLKVKEAKILTAEDAEGREIVVSSKKDIKTWVHGIAHNYAGNDVIKKEYYGFIALMKSNTWISLLFIPPFLYIMFLIFINIKNKQNSDPLLNRSKKAYKIYKSNISTIKPSNQDTKNGILILDALRNYLGSKLKTNPSSLTFKDVNELLTNKKIDLETIKKLGNLFNELEALRYAGSSKIENIKILLDQTNTIVKTLEKKLR